MSMSSPTAPESIDPAEISRVLAASNLTLSEDLLVSEAEGLLAGLGR